MQDNSRIFVDSSEVTLGMLGGSYVNNFLSTGVVEKGFCVVSNKRVYFKGKCFHKVGESIKSTKEERTVDLSDVTGTGFSVSRFFSLKILAILSIIWAVFDSIMCLASGLKHFDDILFYLIICGIMPAAIFCAIYWFTKIKLFEVSFAGGKIAFKASNYNENEIQEFQKILRKAKDDNLSARNSQNAYISDATSNMQNQYTTNSISVVNELKQYKELLDSRVITQEEFEAQKAKLLGMK